MDCLTLCLLALHKDAIILEYCIQGIQKYCKNIDRIIVVSPEKLTDKAEWFNESLFPFTKYDVACFLTKSEEEKKEYLLHKNSRCGWFFQQMLKMYEYAVFKRKHDDMPFFKISRNETKDKKFSRNWLDYINPSDFKK